MQYAGLSLFRHNIGLLAMREAELVKERLEEYSAFLGQTNPKSTIWQSFVYEVKQFLRHTLGKEFEVTDGDVLAFLKKANRRFEYGRGKKDASVSGGSGELLYARASDAKYRDIDKQWWKDFASWRGGNFSRKRQFSFGSASDELILAGFPDAEIVMPAHVLDIKPSSEKHPLPVEKLFNLPKRLRVLQSSNPEP